jgi:hypothetical protein
MGVTTEHRGRGAPYGFRPIADATKQAGYVKAPDENRGALTGAFTGTLDPSRESTLPLVKEESEVTITPSPNYQGAAA